jgi:hypothetical protein
MPRFDSALTVRGYLQVDNHRFAAHLAVLYVLLLFQRSIHQDGDRFTAIGATDGGFLQQVHLLLICRFWEFDPDMTLSAPGSEFNLARPFQQAFPSGFGEPVVATRT